MPPNSIKKKRHGGKRRCRLLQIIQNVLHSQNSSTHRHFKLTLFQINTFNSVACIFFFCADACCYINCHKRSQKYFGRFLYNCLYVDRYRNFTGMWSRSKERSTTPKLKGASLTPHSGNLQFCDGQSLSGVQTYDIFQRWVWFQNLLY